MQDIWSVIRIKDESAFDFDATGTTYENAQWQPDADFRVGSIATFYDATRYEHRPWITQAANPIENVRARFGDPALIMPEENPMRSFKRCSVLSMMETEGRKLDFDPPPCSWHQIHRRQRGRTPM